MTPDERALLERTAALAEENNAMLKKMRRSGRWQLAFQIGYYVVIVGLTFGAFYLIQPYIDSLVGAIGGGSNGAAGGSYSQELQEALGQY